MKKLPLLLSLVLFTLSHAQQTNIVDFKRVEAVILFNMIDVDSTVHNSYKMSFDMLRSSDSIFLDAVNMKFKNVTIDKEPVKFRNDGNKLIVYHDFEASQSYRLDFLFFNSPQKAMYFVGWENDAPNQIWTQGQGKYTSNWLPSIDDMNDKIEFDISIAAPKGYQAIANGKMKLKMTNYNYDLWEYDMLKPMSSYLVALVLGKYDKKVEFSKSGIPLEMYYYPEDSLKFEPTYRYTKRMFDFLEEEIGVPYPWQNYKQVPVHDFLYAGMENTSLTIFADTFVTDSIGFNDRNYINVNAHELAHQWFGNLVTETSGTHHWLHEGFASYYALLAEQEILGDDHFYWELYKTAEQLEAQDLAGSSTALLDPNSNSLTFYQKGAWTLVMLRDKVGDNVFRNAIKAYLKKHEFQNVTTSDFLGIVEELGDLDLTEFAYEWLRNDDFPFDSAMEFLKSKSTFIHEYIMADCEALNSKCYDYLTSDLSDQAKIKILRQQPSLINKQSFKNSLKVRQAIAMHLSRVPPELKTEYESLLNDESYQTIEAALFHLINNFPEDTVRYLKKTKDIPGFNNKSLRMVWLVLAMTSDNFSENETESYLYELINYTDPRFGFEVRMNAFQYLHYIRSCEETCQKNLKNATKHHNWRLQKLAKQLLKENQ
ncbi:MAG: M1 family metallopeptidase [Flavobacteriaceae bacterium]|nr:M1 family metallopeptidase [Flavobacteriaceae bacterium]